MALKNYTTSIEVNKTVGEIQEMLAAHGAQCIMIEYNTEKRANRIKFILETLTGPQGVILPADPERTLSVLRRENIAEKYKSIEQAERVSWRILKDWLSAQLALLKTEMVTVDRILLPYFCDQAGTTIYEKYNKGLLLIKGGN